MSDSTSRLPARPSLEQLRKQAKELLRNYRAGDVAAAERLSAVIRGMAGYGRVWQGMAGYGRVTNAGIAWLAGLPRLREVSVGGSPNVTREGMAVFPATVRANYW